MEESSFLVVDVFNRVGLVNVSVGKIEACGCGHRRPHVGLGGIDGG